MTNNQITAVESNSTQLNAVQLQEQINRLLHQKQHNDLVALALSIQKKNQETIIFLENLAQDYFRNDYLEYASILFDICILIAPHNIDHFSNYAACQHYMGNSKEAAKIFEYVLQICPFHNHSIICYAMLLYQNNQKQAAKEIIERYNNVGYMTHSLANYMGQLCYHFIDKPTGAKWANIALSKAYYRHDYWNALSTIQQRIRIWDTALITCRNALALEHNYYDALMGMGIIYYWMGKMPLSAKYFIKSIRMNPQQPRAYTFLGMVYLLYGRFKKGWRLYNNRLNLPEISIAHRKIPLPFWNGNIQEHTYLFVWPEQGIGDEVRFASLFADLVLHDIPAVIEGDIRLLPLYKRSFPQLKFLPRNDNKSPKINWQLFSHQASIGLLAYYLRPDIFSFNARQDRYLYADKDKITYYRNMLKKPNRYLVGISWYTTNDRNAHQRGIKLKEFLTLFEGLPVDLVNLQYNYDKQEIENAQKESNVNIITIDGLNTRNDIDDIAAIIETCDLIVNISNFTVHLASALGKKTWIFLSNSPLWHWMMKRNDNQWYPNAKIYRQDEMLSWEQPLRIAKEDLKIYIDQEINNDGGDIDSDNKDIYKIDMSLIEDNHILGDSEKETIEKQIDDYLKQGKIDDAIAYIHEKQNKNKIIGELYDMEANIHFRSGTTHKAIDVFEKALENTNEVEKYSIALAKTLIKISQQQEAYDLLKPLCDSNSFINDIANLNLLVDICSQLGLFDEAYIYFDRALTILPNHAGILSDYMHKMIKNADDKKFKKFYKEKSNLLNQDQRLRLERDFLEYRINYDKAIIQARKITDPNASDCQIHANLANKTGNFDEALALFRQSAELETGGSYTARTNLAWQLLLMEQYEEGWHYYHYRHLNSLETANRKFLPIQYWQGEDLTNKTVYIWAEQAIGDEITFATQFPSLMQKYPQINILCEVAPRLINIFRRSFPNISFIERDKEPNKELIADFAADYMLASGDIGRFTRPNADSFIEQPEHILYSDEELYCHYRHELASRAQNKKIIAISWFSSRRAARNIDLDKICKALKSYNILLVNVQYGDGNEEFMEMTKKHNIDSYIPPNIDLMNDIDDLCAILDCCDVVVTITNFTAVLAGALAKPTFAVSPEFDHWFRGFKGNKAPWYPTYHVYRNINHEDEKAMSDSLHAYLKRKNID